MNTTSRREFLGVTASLGAVAAIAGTAGLHAESEAAPGPVRAWITTKDKKFQPIESPPQWKTGSEVSPLGVHLEPGARYQEMVGFGGAFTDASCYLMNRMAPEARHALLSGPLWARRDCACPWDEPALARAITATRCIATTMAPKTLN